MSQPLTPFLEQSREFRKACATIYIPLDAQKSQIRLVRIQPAATEDEDIHLMLDVVSLDDQPAFEAVSYTWGSQSPVVRVYLHDFVYYVTQNQYQALRRFRHADQVRTMWMDVICINQDDVEEKSSQVRMMSRIYSTSQQTQIWLGEIDAESTKGFTDEQWSTVQTWFWKGRNREKMAELLVFTYENEFNNRAERTSAFNNSVEQPDGIVHGAIHILKQLGTDAHYWDLPSCFLDSAGEAQISRSWFESMQTLKAILLKPYWYRVWTIQEAILSPVDAKVYIGKHEIPFSHFMDLGKGVSEHIVSTACCRTLGDVIMYEDETLDSDNFMLYVERFMTLFLLLRHLESGKLNFATALQLSNKMEAFDARDHVYGSLGFASYGSEYDVDYSLSVSQVFQTATLHCWLSRGSVGYLKKGSLDCQGRLPGLPSWCIDFTDSERLSFQFYESFFENELVDWDTVNIDTDTGRLTLQGIPLVTIKSCFERSDSVFPGITDENLRIISDWTSKLRAEDFELNTDLDPQTNTSFFRRFFDAIFRDTIVGTREGAGPPRRLDEAAWEDIEFWWSAASQGSRVEEWDMERKNEVRERTKRQSLAFFLGLKDSTLAITSDNQLSLVPLATEPGDQLFHITGCCVPLVLREVESDLDLAVAKLALAPENLNPAQPDEPAKREFRIVGPCYVKGMMGSQGIQGLQSERITII